MKRTCVFLVIPAILLFSTMLAAQKRHKSPGSKPVPTKKAAVPEIPAQYRDLLDGSSQAIVVTTANWNAVDGSLQRYDKRDGKWQAVGDKIPIVVGKNGLAWDGLVEAPPEIKTVKKEGDGRSPAGILTLGEAFGFAPSAPDLKLPYKPLSDSIECVDDPSSQSYNQVVDRNELPHPDWNSSEKMRSIDVYKEGVVVNYNGEHVPDAGSCIFMHIWKGSGRGTAGCTAMPENNLQQVMSWLDESKKPVLIQFPEPFYRQIRAAWKLP